MPPDPRKVVFPNPFYVALIVASTAFMVTTFAYLFVPMMRDAAMTGPDAAKADPAAVAAVRWLEAKAPIALAVEFALMLASGLLAMALDRKFSPKAGAKAGPPA